MTISWLACGLFFYIYIYLDIWSQAYIKLYNMRINTLKKVGRREEELGVCE